ncbi:hypothetical protein I3W98_08360 [Streptomyces cavourensis]|nr:hypothetical protein [Streptomyces cavourensis]
MAVFRIERFSPLPAAEAWRRVTDWERHAEHVPLTAITVAGGAPTRVGTVFTARTGVGPLAFDDPMEVVRWTPPAGGRAGVCLLEKRGSVGRAAVRWTGSRPRARCGARRTARRWRYGRRATPPFG